MCANKECKCQGKCPTCKCKSVYTKYEGIFLRSGYLLVKEGPEKFFWNPSTNVRLAWDGKNFVEI